jgi:hypothetical protein
MKHRHMAATASGVALAFIVTLVLAAPSRDRFSLKSANGIRFSEFKGYERWQLIAPSNPADADGCGSSPPPGCIKAVIGNPAMIKAYQSGIPGNGTPVPDGAAMAKLEWRKGADPESPYAATVPGALSGVSFMVKDSKRFSETDGWGYVTFEYEPSSDTFKPSTDDPSVARTSCHECHTRGAKKRDFVYTQYPKR